MANHITHNPENIGQGSEFSGAMLAHDLTEAIGSASPEWQTAQATEFKFVLVEHTPKHSEAVAAALKDSDVLAFELVGYTAEIRQAYEEALTDYLRPDQADQRLARLESIFQTATPFIATVAKQFIGSGKQVRLIDISTEDPEFDSADKLMATHKAFRNSVSELAPAGDIHSSLTDYLEAFVTSSQQREALIATQLQAIANEPRADNQKFLRIGVVVGSDHYRLEQDMLKRGYQTNQKLVMGQRPYLDEASLEYIPGEPVRPELLNRIILMQYYEAFDPPQLAPNKKLTYQEQRAAALNKLQQSVLERMTDNDISALLSEIERLKTFRPDGQEPTTNISIELHANRLRLTTPA